MQNKFQPGSTAKVITAAAALEQGGQTPMSPYTIPYQILRGGQAIHDAEWPGRALHDRRHHRELLQRRHVPGRSAVPAQVQYGYLRAFGLGQPTGLGLPRTTATCPPSQWSGDTRYTLSFGQGLAVNAVQMASVYATIANGGVRVRPP